MDARPPSTHRKAYFFLHIPTGVGLGLGSFFGVLGSFCLPFGVFLYFASPERFGTDAKTLFWWAIGLMIAGGVLLLGGLFIFQGGVGCLVLGEKLKQSDAKKGYRY